MRMLFWFLNSKRPFDFLQNQVMNEILGPTVKRGIPEFRCGILDAFLFLRKILLQ